MNQIFGKPCTQNPLQENQFWKFWNENQKNKKKHRGVEMISDPAPLSTLGMVDR